MQAPATPENFQLSAVLDRLEQAEGLDRAVTPVSAAVQKALGRRVVQNALHGVPLGHAVHPILVQVPIGAWVSAGVLDVVPRTGPAVPTLITVGITAAVPAAAAGLADWSQQHPQQKRVGLVHAGLNLLAVALYAKSLRSRMRSRGVRGRAWAYAGLATVGVSGFLGGHLSYRSASGTNHAEPVPHLVTPGWHDVGALDELPDGLPQRRDVGDVPVVVLRRGAQVSVLSGRCSHLDGPLWDGEVVQDDDQSECVRCPWHGSVFRFADGSVYRGPATAPQPVFDVQVTEGRVRVCLPGADG